MVLIKIIQTCFLYYLTIIILYSNFIFFYNHIFSL
jgi:hypothetical protein